ncbi:hypothetical protein UCDDA912_g00886 [Diaporthe ampelina]|uniref:Mfs transporter n=1 Tax=Diaporthe ampelina TaxID=1214573 RepID=A0A0G2FYY4_9PEZI|nr:hypothetical protein UCDDA912_g00886 [Diaporthe ampelina]
MNRLSVLILLLGAFASLAVAASAPTFCKCTCFTNSTIIEIKPKSSKGGSPSSPPAQHQPPSKGTTDPDDNHAQDSDQDALGGADLDDAIASAIGDAKDRRLARRAQGSSSSLSCNQCNRSFCLSQSLPICKGAADKDVTTMCFKRDSRKDQIIVWGFILGTAGLLGWAGVQKAVDLRQRGGLGSGIPGIGGGGAGAGAGGPPRGRREGDGILPLGRGALGSTGTDGGRGAYAAVAGHSREGSLQTN